MPAYHSVFLDEPNQQTIGNLALLPLRTRTRGPAQSLPALSAPETSLTIDAQHASYDPVDEALSLFRANTLFRNFEIHGPADRTLIYSILFLSSLLPLLKPTTTRREAEKIFNNVALDVNFALPGEPGFPLSGQGAFEAPKSRQEAEVLRGYLGQVRQEVAARLGERLFEGKGEGEGPSKWWLSFSKRKFMGKAL